MKYYPVNLNIEHRKCLVVGGGPVAFRKAKMLMDCGATVMVVSKLFSPEFQKFNDMPTISLIQREYSPIDLDGKLLVISATDDSELNRRISADAEKKNMLCNIADVPEICNFILPSVIRRGDLVVSVSTSGKSPAFAKHLRKDLEKNFGDEYARFLYLMGAIRKKLLQVEHAPETHKHLFEKMIEGGLLAMIKNNQIEGINRLLAEVVGEGYDFDELMNSESRSQESTIEE
jgi:precorrin-2 dehydrogenase / sirohydrochlorin ferrochelatase